MPRFYINAGDVSGNTVFISGEDAHHITRVLRMREGELLEAGDGEGRLYRLVLTKLTPGEVRGEIIERIEDDSEPAVKVRLFQSVLKGEKMDWVLQKGTEVGIFSFHPFFSLRTVVRREATDLRKKEERWSRIVLEAAKQCGRGLLPKVFPAALLQELKDPLTASLSLVAWEGNKETSLRGVLSQAERPALVSLIIGPEGGFAAEEIEMLAAWGVKPVSLGPRILRAETAGPVMAALVLYHYGEMEP